MSTPAGTGGLRPAAFIDRDGVINEERHYVSQAADFHLLPGVVEALHLLARSGYALVVVTNQAGIAKGLYGEADFERLTLHMRALFQSKGITLDGVYHCPHHPQALIPALALNCDCRKPMPGMLLRAARELHLDLARSVIVGDKVSDIQAGRAAGVRLAVLVESGHSLEPGAALQADLQCADLLAAARWIAQAGRPAGASG